MQPVSHITIITHAHSRSREERVADGMGDEDINNHRADHRRGGIAAPIRSSAQHQAIRSAPVACIAPVNDGTWSQPPNLFEKNEPLACDNRR